MTKIERYPHYVGLDNREIAAVLAGLRLVELLGFGDKDLDNARVARIDSSPSETARQLHDIYNWIYTDSGEIDGLTYDEIATLRDRVDKLCERINTNTTTSDPSHPQYEKGFDNGWHAGRGDAYAHMPEPTRRALRAVNAILIAGALSQKPDPTPHISVIIEEHGAIVNDVWAFADEVEATGFYNRKWRDDDVDPEDEEAVESAFNNDGNTYLHYRVPIVWNPHI